MPVPRLYWFVSWFVSGFHYAFAICFAARRALINADSFFLAAALMPGRLCAFLGAESFHEKQPLDSVATGSTCRAVFHLPWAGRRTHRGASVLVEQHGIGAGQNFAELWLMASQEPDSASLAPG